MGKLLQLGEGERAEGEMRPQVSHKLAEDHGLRTWVSVLGAGAREASSCSIVRFGL